MMDFNNIDFHLSNTHINKRFKSFQLDLLDKNYESDTQTINNFDDEYGEIPNLNKTQKLKNFDKDKLYQKNEGKEFHPKKEKYSSNSFNKKLIDTNLKNLMEMNTNNKKDIIDILFKNNLIQKKKKDETAIIKEKNRNRYYYIESKTKPNLSSFPLNTYGRKGFLIEPEEGNPEFIKDINYAKYKIKKRIRRENELVADLLFNGTDLMSYTTKSLSRKEIGKKIDNILEKKKKNLQKIEMQIYEQQKLEQTFSPSINRKKNDEIRRNFDLFLKDQDEYQKKIKIKNKNLLLKSQSEEQLLNLGKPLIDKKSELIAKKLDFDKNVYLRLYQNDTYDKNKNRKEKKFLELTNKNNTNANLRNSKEKKDKYSYIQPKINIWKEKGNKNKDNSKIKTLAKRAKSSNDLLANKKNSFDLNDVATNRMIYNKFNKNFEKNIENIFSKKCINGSSGIDINIKKINNENELDENQYYELLYNLGMINFVNNEKTLNNINGEIKTNNTSFSKERVLVNNLFNILKLGNDKIKIQNLKIFLCFVLNLHYYYLYHQYKLNHNPEELQKLYPLDKYKKEEIPLAMIKKYNEELLSSVDKSNLNNTKYFYINKNDNNKIIITLDNYIHIKTNFSLLSLNYRNHKNKNVPKSILFLQNINSNFYSKIYPQLKEGFNTSTHLRKRINKSDNNIFNIDKSKNNNNNIEYIDRILLLDKRRKAKNEQIKQELENKKIQECTFKPKLNMTVPSFLFKKQNLLTKKNTKKNKHQRLEEMYEQGKNTVKAKRDKTKIEIEIEEQISECTFKPKIYSATNQKKLQNNFNNDIYNERQYKSLYERLKQGRLNQMIKDGNNDRYELDNKLKKYIKDYKEHNVLNSQAYYKADSCYYNNNNIYINENQNTEENVMENCNLFVDINNKQINNKNNDINLPIKESSSNIGKSNVRSENGDNKKEPLLIINMNIKEGISKKINVFIGDTSKSLAKKLALEYNLDIETQKNLENIIHNQMVKPLSKIDEENFSGSEKN